MINKKRTIGSWLYLILIFIFLYAPIAVLIIFSFNSSSSRGQWTGFSLQWYESALQNDSLMSAIYYTIVIAVIAAIAATIIGTFAAIAIHSLSQRWQGVMMNATYIPILSPSIVTAVSLMILFLFVNMQLGFSTLLIAHITFCTPYVILSVMPKLRQMDNNLYEAALDLGAKPMYALMKVVMPQLTPGIVTGMIMAFTLSLDDFVISFFTTGSGVANLSIEIYSMARKGVSPEINAVSAILFVVVLVLLLIVNWRGAKDTKAKAH